MNEALERLATEIGLAAPAHERWRLAFGHACVLRVAHLLEEAAVMACIGKLGAYLRGEIDHVALQALRRQADQLANQHPGSRSIDGCGHAAVSASYAVAHAVNGRALQAASYAAYATVYAGGGYAAVAQREAFESEFAWQIAALTDLTAGGEVGAWPVGERRHSLIAAHAATPQVVDRPAA
jgi:hypothetical protein